MAAPPSHNNPREHDPGAEMDPPPRIRDHELLRRIGAGAYGEVWLARNAFGAFRAIKVVRRSSFSHDGPYERELAGIRNFEPVSRTHAGLIDILHTGIDEAKGCFYCVMEAADDRVSGGEIDPATYTPKTLQSEMQNRRFSADETIALGIALAAALASLHGRNLIHRDIKPSNILFVRGRPRLGDVGLVSRFDATVSLVGTDGYLPPEGPRSPQSDLYSLGKVLYQATTGNEPSVFPELPTATRPDSESRPNLLLELNQVLLRACEFDPRDRYPSAAAMAEDLRLIQSGQSVTRLRRLEKNLRFARRLAAGALALLIAGLAVYGYQFRHSRQMERMAEENQLLADRHQEMLIAAEVDGGFRQLLEGNPHRAIPSFVRALEGAEGDARKEEPQRYRLKALLDEHPKLLAVVTHDDRIRQCNFSPDGTRIVTAGNDGVARIWDAATGEPIGQPLRHDGAVARAWFDSSGTRVLTRSADGTAAFWNAQTGERLVTFHHEPGLTRALLAPDDSRVLVTGGASARIWSVSGGPVSPIIDHGATIRIAGFHPGGQIVWTAGADGFVQFRDLGNPETPIAAASHGSPMLHAALSPDGERLATAGTDGTVAVWKWRQSRSPEFRLPHSSDAVAVAFSPDGTMLVTSDRPARTLRVWSADDGKPIRTFEGNLSLYPAFSPDGAHVVYSSFGNEARFVNLKTGEPYAPPVTGGWFDSASFSPDGHRVAIPSTFAGIVRVWDLASAPRDRVTLKADRPIITLAYSEDGSMLATGGSEIRVWNSETGRPATPPMFPSAEIALLQFSSDGSRLLAAGGRGYMNTSGRAWLHSHEVAVWNTSNGESMFPPLSPGGCIRHAAFSPDGQSIVTGGSRREIRFWNSLSGEPRPLVLPHEKSIHHFAFNSDGTRLAVAAWNQVVLWNLETAEPVFAPFQHDQPVEQVGFSPDGRWLITSSFFSQRIFVWEAATGESAAALEVPESVGKFAIAGDGDAVLTAGTSCGGIYSLPLMRGSIEPVCHNEKILHAAWHSDGSMILTQSENWIRVSSSNNGLPVIPAINQKFHPETVRSTYGTFYPALAAFHPQRAEFATISGTNAFLRTIRPDSRPTSDLAALARLMAGNDPPRDSPPDEEDVAAEWRRLRAIYPEEFVSDPAAVRDWHRQLAANLVRSGQTSTALWHLRRLEELSPDDAETFAVLAQALRMQNRFAAAAESARAAVRLRGSPRDYYDLVLSQLAAGDSAAARTAGQAALDKFFGRGDFSASLVAAWTFALIPFSEYASPTIPTRFEHDASDGAHSANPEVAIVTAALHLRANDPARARAHLAKAVELIEARAFLAGESILPRIHALKSLAHLADGDPNAARESFASFQEWFSQPRQLNFDQQLELEIFSAQTQKAFNHYIP